MLIYCPDVKFRVKIHEVKKRTAEYRISNRRISKGGIATLYLFLAKIDRIPF